jgi:hypothetical protein
MNARKTLTTALLSAGLLVAAPGAALVGGSAVGHAATPNRTCHYEPERQVDRRVRMSDLHGWKGVSATFRYAADHSADTYVGLAVQDPTGHWKAGGMDHVTNAKVFGQTATIGRGDRRVTGVFKFNIIKRVGRKCPPGTDKRFTRALSFEGGMRIEKHKAAPRGLSGRCNRARGRRKLFPHTSAFTATAHSFSYDHAFSLFGVTLGSSTTYSKNAQIELKNHTRHAIWLCGTSTSGGAVPVADAAMLYAGPRVRHK